VAERRRSKAKPDLTPDAAAPPPGEPPDTIPIYGILGESPVASSVRLYLDRGMSTYYDIPVEGIAGREKVPTDRSPLGVDSTLLFVRKGIRLVVHRSHTRSVEEEFVAGDFTAPGTFTATPAAHLPPRVVTPIVFASLGFTCTLLTPGCPAGTAVTGTVVTGTVFTLAFTLAIGTCPSAYPCHTHAHVACPPASALDRCPTVRICPTRPRRAQRPHIPPPSATPHCPSSLEICA
jgi:hypothetical protein